MSRRLLVTVSRSWADAHTAEHWLGEAFRALRYDPQTILVSGNAGDPDKCDRLLESIWEAHGGQIERHKANWSEPCGETCTPGHRKGNRQGWSYCPAAGTRRNQLMVDLGADLCLELREPCRKDRCWDRRKGHWSHGAEDCADRAEAAGIPTWRVPS